jgi:hypothetical protein
VNNNQIHNIIFANDVANGCQGGGFYTYPSMAGGYYTYPTPNNSGVDYITGQCRVLAKAHAAIFPESK